jgi:DNA-binding NarL/FixJ family response regulator
MIPINLPTNLFKPKASKSETIFIVEDNPVFAQVLKTFLSSKLKNSAEIFVFPSGESCLLELHRSPSTIIIDYFLGSSSDEAVTGLETIIQLRKKKNDANIIILSAWREDEIPLETIKEYNYSNVQKNAEALKKVEKIIRRL